MKEKFEMQREKFSKSFEKKKLQVLQNFEILKEIYKNPEGKYERKVGKFGRTKIFLKKV